MANQNKKEKEKEKKDTTHTTSSGRVKGGTGGSFANTKTPSVVSRTASYPSEEEVSPAAMLQNMDTLKQFAQAQRGLNAYASDQQRNAGQKTLPLSYAPSDAPAVVHSFHNAVNAYAADDSNAGINPNWTFDQKLNFGYLYDTSPKRAKEYATSVNDVLAKTLTKASRSRINESAAKSVASGAAHTAAALGVSVLAPMAEALDRAAEFSARGRITEKPYITPMDYVREVRTGIRDNLNTNTLDEDIPILGGRGLGDLYDLGFGVAESWLSANTIGRAFGAAGKMTGALAVAANSFARTSTSAMDAARRSGADGKQSVALGISMGLIEAAADLLPADSLLKITPKTTVREFLGDSLKHGALEGLTETLCEGLGQVAEYRILGNESSFAQRRSGYLHRGATPEEASRKALRDSFVDLGFTMLAGTAAGTVAAGAQSVLEKHLADIRACEAQLKENEYDVGELFQLRRELQYISGSYERFTPEGQQRWQAMEDRYSELLTKAKNSTKALEDRQTHLDSYRKALDEHGYEMPFTPELYRLAVEMSTPDGWGEEFRYSDYLSAAEKTDWEADISAADQWDHFSENAIEKIRTVGYNRGEESEYRLRFMSNRDTAFRNMEAVEHMAGYQDVAIHADAYGFAAQDPETEELLLDISAKELAYRIMDSGKYNGGPIRLLACSAGAAEDGAAQQLADLLKVPVLAPTDTLFTSMDGYMAVATKESEAIEMMSQMQKQNKKSSMEGWKLYEPR